MNESDICVAFPSGNTTAANATLSKWHERGYRSAVYIDHGQKAPDSHLSIEADPGPYVGFTTAANALCQLCYSRGAQIVVLAGDDIDPVLDLSAGAIGEQFIDRFGGKTFGLMQPAGDEYGALVPGFSYPAAVSPWIGREFIRRSYQGKGPFWPEYRDLYGDTEIMAVAKLLGCYWHASELTQYHRHWSRGCVDTLPADKRKRITDNTMSDYLLFNRRRDGNFPGHEVIE